MFFKKKPTFNKIAKTNVLGDSLNSLMPNGELPFGWSAHNSDYFKEFESKIYFYSSILELSDIDEKIKQLEVLISTYNTFKEKCYAESECHKKYFQDMWEHYSNSQKSDFEFVDNIKESLSYLQDNYTGLINTQKILNEYLPTMPTKIDKIISSNVGILQTDVYKMFPSEMKDSISEYIYFQSKAGKIKREKSGRTYKLYIIN